MMMFVRGFRSVGASIAHQAVRNVLLNILEGSAKEIINKIF